VDQVGGLGVKRIDEENVDRAAFRQGLEVGVDVGREFWRNVGRCGLLIEFREAVDGLRLAVFLDGEVGLLQAADGMAFGVGDRDVNDGLAGVELQGRDGGGGRVFRGSRVPQVSKARPGAPMPEAAQRVRTKADGMRARGPRRMGWCSRLRCSVGCSCALGSF
jgi:hypothetical protein